LNRFDLEMLYLFQQSEVMDLIKFLYTGNFECKNEEEIISFLILARKFEVKNISELKIQNKDLLFKLIEYTEKDLEKKKRNFWKVIRKRRF